MYEEIELSRKKILTLQIYFANITMFFMVVGIILFIMFLFVSSFPLMIIALVFQWIGLGLTIIYLVIMLIKKVKYIE